MGADSAGTVGYDLTIRKDKKVFKKSNDHGDVFLIGYSGSFRSGQILQYIFDPPPCYSYIDTHEYMVRNFVTSAKETFKKSGEETPWFLIGINSRLFEVASDWQVGEPTLSYHSIGCGSSYAKGAMFSNHHIGDPEKRIIDSLECSEYFSAGVRGPFIVESI